MTSANSDQQAPEAGLWPVTSHGPQESEGLTWLDSVSCLTALEPQRDSSSGLRKRNFRKGFRQMAARKKLPETETFHSDCRGGGKGLRKGANTSPSARKAAPQPGSVSLH